MTGSRPGGETASSLQPRLAALLIEPQPRFEECLALARELQRDRHAPVEQQVAVCRALARAIPASPPPAAVLQLTALAIGWVAAPAGSTTATTAGTSMGDAAAASQLQLQAEAVHLLVSMVGSAKARLPAPAASQLLQAVCRLCQRPPRPAGSVAAHELACGCMELLAQLPQWCPQVSKAELAAAVAAVVAVLGQQQSSSREEAVPTTRLLCKVLRALQVLLTEAKADHGANAATLAAALQHLFTYGWQQRGGSGSSTPRRSSGLASAGFGAVTAASAVAPPVAVPSQSFAAAAGSSKPPAASPSRYRPPHARRSTQGEPAAGPGTSSSALHLESSDSESSDTEGSGSERHRASRVRSGALACLQLLAKADSKSLHGSWTALLPTSDAVASRHARGGVTSVAHLLLHDPQLRVRHAAAATITTLLEGPAQRAYLAVAEARELDRQPVRGFITLSASLGQMLVALHRALLHSVQSECDPLVLSATLRALGTLLLGAPYHRLPPQLLPLCVQALLGCLAKATPPQPAGVATLAPEQLPVVSACLTCLAAAFSSKAAGAQLLQDLGPAAGSSSSGGRHEQLLQLLLSYAGCQHAALQLEAVMALRGVAQQHAALLDDHWGQLLAIARAGAALHAGPQPSRPQGGDGTLPEKVAQQSVRLAGDYLEARAAAGAHSDASETSATAAEAQRWQQVALQVLQPAIRHASPLLRAAAQAVIGGLSPAVLAALPPTLQRQLLAWCCDAVAADEASPVRTAAAKAVGAMADAPALCAQPEGPAQLLSALAAANHDAVLAVRLPAAASLATLCSMLSAGAATDAGVQAAAQQVFPGCLLLALAAATADNDKLRPSGLQALGSLATLAEMLPPAAAAEQEQQLGAAVAAASGGFASKSARVQWAACEAAGALLACGAAPVEQHAAALLQQLLVLLRECPNFRSRAQAAGALLRLRSWAALGGSGSRAVQLLDDVAAVLFQGKANDFSVPAPAAAAASQRSSAARQEPGELGSKTQLEAALVAAVLHLLSLLPLADGVPAGSSSQLPHMRALAQQAQHELLPPAGLATDEAGQGSGAAATVYFDLSQASPQLMSAALHGLALL